MMRLHFNLFAKLLIVDAIGSTFFWITMHSNFGINGFPLWFSGKDIDVNHVSPFVGDMARSYGFFAAAFGALSTHFIFFCKPNADQLRSFCRCNAVIYCVWFFDWFLSLYVLAHWQLWVLLLYCAPGMRMLQALGFLYFGFFASDEHLEPDYEAISEKATAHDE